MSPEASDQLRVDPLEAFHYAYPAFVFFYFLVALTITVCTLQTQRLRVQDEHVRRDVILAFIAVVTVLYLAEAITAGFKAMILSAWPDQHEMVYLIASAIVFGAQALALTDSKFPVWWPYYGTWFVGLIAELCFLIVPSVIHPPRSYLDYIEMTEKGLRVCVFVILPTLYFSVRDRADSYDNFDAERQALLRKKLDPKAGSEESTLNGNGYGTTTDSSAKTSDTSSDTGSEDSWLARQRKAKEAIEKRLRQDGNWFTYAKGFSIFFPYLWPVHNKTLQFRAVLVGGTLLAGNAFNLLVPRQLGIVVDSLTKWVEGDQSRNIWMPLIIYAALGIISGSACIGWIRKWLWMPVEQYSYDAISTASHTHIMNLSSDFHDNKTSSDLSQAISGGRSVADLLETVLFQVIPMFIDLAVAFTYLLSLFGPYMGLMMAATVVCYLYTTTKLAALRADQRRDYVVIYRKEWNVGHQSLDSWSTASLFNMIPYEEQRYAGAVKDHLKAKQKYEMSVHAANAATSIVMMLGKLGALALGAYQVAYSGKSIGQFTTLFVYWGQLQSPLIFFSAMYRQISNSLMEAERLLELFQTKPTITDSPMAKPLKLSKGLVAFNDVSFAYDERKPTLKNVSFNVPAGKTVALVGETGGGKSTILKLIDRFYDVKGGSISIDGQDIRNVTISSLREKIGVVPQDPTLFNDSIMNNIRYARISATDEEVYEACKAAAVHDKIISFPDGYNSKVGDRGVKLSGGEKQRVAIARAILKQPEIILLDEATSAVDTETEQIIQEGLKALCQGRTTFIVAHRLSTIMKADRILVVMNGEIIEEGTHFDLIHANGKYQDLWSKQIFLKPSPENNRSKSADSKKRDADIIDDISNTHSTVRLATAMKKVPHEKSSGGENGDSNIGDNSTSKSENSGTENHAKEMGYGKERRFTNKHAEDSANKGKSEGNQNREGSRLKPDAPEFIPIGEVPSRQSSQKAITKEAAKRHRKQEKEEQKKAETKLAKKTDSFENGVPATDGAQSPMRSKAPENLALPPIEMIKPRRGKHYSRRHLARSEPAGKVAESYDGQRESEGTASGSGEAQPLFASQIPQFRRVSAPSDPPAGPQERVHGRRRAKHWRLKRGLGSNRSTGSASGSGLGMSTGGNSSEDVSAPCPPPLPSPAELLPPKPSIQPPKVHFSSLPVLNGSYASSSGNGK